jgi:hypothetical protein
VRVQRNVRVRPSELPGNDSRTGTVRWHNVGNFTHDSESVLITAPILTIAGVSQLAHGSPRAAQIALLDQFQGDLRIRRVSPHLDPC